MRITTVPISLLVLLKNQLRYMSKYFDVTAVSSGGEILDKVKDEAGVKVKAVAMTRKITPFKDLVALTQLIHTMRTDRPQIVHTHTPKAGLLGMLAAKIAGVPIRLHTVAGLPLLEKTGVTRKILNATEKLTCSCATMVYPNSKGMAQIMLDNGFCDAGKLKVIGNGSSDGVDTHRFDPAVLAGSPVLENLRHSLNIKPQSFVFSFIGRMVSDKGLNELVEAFTNLYQTNQHIILLLIGPYENDLDPLTPHTANLVATHPGIRWIDFQADIRPYLALSQVFVFPSYREGFPNVVMQAGSMGVPCIVSDINGCNEIITQGFNGLIVPAKNEPELQKAMDTLLKDNALRERMAAVSRQAIVSRFESAFVISELLKEYQLQVSQLVGHKNVSGRPPINFLNKKYV